MLHYESGYKYDFYKGQSIIYNYYVRFCNLIVEIVLVFGNEGDRVPT